MEEADAPFAPNSIDLLLDRVQRIAPALTRISGALLLLASGVLALGDLAVWATDPSVDTGRLGFSIGPLVPGLGLLAIVALALRMRWRAQGLAMLAVCSITLTAASWSIGTSVPPSFAALFALAALTIEVLHRDKAGTAVLLSLAAAFAVAAEALRPAVGAAAYLLVLCEGAFGAALAAGVYLRWSDWRRRAAEAAARSDERLELARELHDLVGHHVTAMVVTAQAARHVSGHRPDAAPTALERIETAGVLALDAMNRLVHGLRAESGSTVTGTWTDVEGLLEAAVVDGDPLLVTIDPAIRTTEPSLAPSVHRIVAEALTNVRRHARDVTRVRVDLRRSADTLVVTVHDDGATVGGPPPGRHTFGVMGMRERATSLGGSLLAGPSAQGGWLVRAELPITPLS